MDPQHPGLSIARQCELLELPRWTWYYTPAATADTVLHELLKDLLNCLRLRGPWRRGAGEPGANSAAPAVAEPVRGEKSDQEARPLRPRLSASPSAAPPRRASEPAGGGEVPLSPLCFNVSIFAHALQQLQHFVVHSLACNVERVRAVVVSDVRIGSGRQ